MIRDICKPLIVDLLRTFDKNRWLSPKIRYASVRSKDQLIKDLTKHFKFQKRKHILTFVPIHQQPRHPVIQFDFQKKQYLFDGLPLDVPTESRSQPEFSVRHGRFLLNFDMRDTFPTVSQPTEEDVRAIHIESDFFRESPKPDTGAPSDSEEQTSPFLLCL